MANRWQIPHEVEIRLRRTFKVCAYCGRNIKAYIGVTGCFRDKATIEHLNRNGPFYWSDRLQEKHLVVVCHQCNASRGKKRLSEWFKSSYCLNNKINARTVAARVRQYFHRNSSKVLSDRSGRKKWSPILILTMRVESAAKPARLTRALNGIWKLRYMK